LCTIVIHNAIYYHLSYTANYNTFRLDVYPTSFDIYNVIIRGIYFNVTNQTLAQGNNIYKNMHNHIRNVWCTYVWQFYTKMFNHLKCQKHAQPHTINLSYCSVCNIKIYTPDEDTMDVKTCQVNSQPKCVKINSIWQMITNHIIISLQVLAKYSLVDLLRQSEHNGGDSTHTSHHSTQKQKYPRNIYITTNNNTQKLMEHNKIEYKMKCIIYHFK
jgi:hypothetical protein